MDVYLYITAARFKLPTIKMVINNLCWLYNIIENREQEQMPHWPPTKLYYILIEQSPLLFNYPVIPMPWIERQANK